MHIGNRLRECREYASLKQVDVARKLNIQRQIISYYEKDKRVPDIDKLVKLADLYNVTTDYLLGRTEIKTFDTKLVDDIIRTIRNNVA